MPSLRNRLRSPASQEVVATLKGLLEQAMQNLPDCGCWDQVQDVLEALPLPTDSFGTAVNRLRNARNYATQGELGAAKFELRQILKSVG